MRGRGRPRHPDVLTPRQWEVLGLVQEGLTNEEIADRLGISERGAKFHVSEILGKLGMANRYEAASWQPSEAAVARERRPWALALAPFGALRRLHWNVAAQVAAIAGTLVVVAGIAALAWGVMQTRGSPGAGGSPADALSTASSSRVIGSPAAVSPPGGVIPPTETNPVATPGGTPVSVADACPPTTQAFGGSEGTTLIDVDGDGAGETVGIAPLGDSTQPPDRLGLLVYSEPSERGTYVQLPRPSIERTAVIGGYDVNGDGREEIFVIDGNGAYTQYIDLYEFDPAACQLVRLASPDQFPQFLFGASVQNGSAFRCEDGKLVSIEYSDTPSTSDPPLYTETRTTYVIDGMALRVVSVEKNLPLEPLGGGLNCGGLKLPPF